MRKILLATAATIGAGLALSGTAHAQAVKPVAPGSIVVHVNGYFQFEIGAIGSTDNQDTYAAPAVGAYVPTASVGAAGTYKDGSITTDGDARIYAGFDAATLDDVDYGAQIEVRTGFSDPGVGQSGKVSPTVVSTSTTTVAGATYTTKTTTTEANAEDDALYVQRAYGYLGTKQAGTVRFGQTDSAFTLLQTGVIEAFGDGTQFSSTAGNEASLVPGDAGLGGGSNFIYADQSNLYATDKVVYLTPSFEDPLGGKLSGAFGYEPNSNGLKEGYSTYSTATSLSGDLTTTANGADLTKRRRNTIDAAVEYSLKSDDVLYKASAGLLYGAPLAYDGATALTAAQKVDDLDVYQFGGQATFAGLTLGANIKGGQTLDGYSFKPKGARDAFAYIIGGDYVIGPYVIGASFFNSQSAGGYAPGSEDGRTLEEYGTAVGGNYVVGKDLSLFLQYEYDHRHQYHNAAIDVNDTTRGDAQAQVVAAGATLKW